jgi:hypothetical protein
MPNQWMGAKTSVLFFPFVLADIIQRMDLLDDLVVAVQNILRLEEGSFVLLHQFQLGAYAEERVQNGLFLRIQGHSYRRRVRHVGGIREYRLSGSAGIRPGKAVLKFN